MRYLFVALFIHILVLNFVWVGFSVPRGQEQNSFTYLGELVAGTEGNAPGSISNQQPKVFDVFKEPSSAFFTPWIKMREVDKPR